MSDEVVPEWDVYRDGDGNPVTITDEQSRAIWHAVHIVEAVRRAEDYPSLSDGAGFTINASKSRLLGRMLIDGRPPTRTKPPISWGGPNWSALPGGDPFDDRDWKALALEARDMLQRGDYDDRDDQRERLRRFMDATR